MWIIVLLIVIVAAVIAGSFVRSSNYNYRIGSGMFKSSDDNLEEKEEISDKEYYDRDGLFK